VAEGQQEQGGAGGQQSGGGVRDQQGVVHGSYDADGDQQQPGDQDQMAVAQPEPLRETVDAEGQPPQMALSSTGADSSASTAPAQHTSRQGPGSMAAPNSTRAKASPAR
jgi:hypothetical protein